MNLVGLDNLYNLLTWRIFKTGPNHSDRIEISPLSLISIITSNLYNTKMIYRYYLEHQKSHWHNKKKFMLVGCFLHILLSVYIVI